MNSKEIPIAVPTIIPIINPISKSELDVLLELVTRSLSEISIVELFGSVSLVKLSGLVSLVEFSISITIDFDGILFSGLEIMSDERFVNFALSVIDSVVESPPNNVECVKSE
jgi:hypothetical protein